MDSSKVEVRETTKYGKAIFAKNDIKRDEVIADWSDGIVYTAKHTSDLPNDPPLFVRDHAIPFSANKWIDTTGIGRFLAHSCDPNCGFKDEFHIVAMRDIKTGEECTFDYEMCEDSDWRMECLCGKPSCRGIIGATASMPQKTREKYGKYLAPWIKRKYGIETNVVSED